MIKLKNLLNEEPLNEAIKYNKDGFVTKMENEAGKVVKDITLDGEKFVLKGNKYVSKKGGKDLHKSHFGIKESINEGPSTEEKRIAMLAVRKQAKYRTVSLEQAIQDQINALMDLQRDIKRGKKIK